MKIGEADTWESRPLERLRDTSKLPGSKYCTQRTSVHYTPSTHPNITHYYLWFPADMCYSWVSTVYAVVFMYSQTILAITSYHITEMFVFISY